MILLFYNLHHFHTLLKAHALSPKLLLCFVELRPHKSSKFVGWMGRHPVFV